MADKITQEQATAISEKVKDAMASVDREIMLCDNKEELIAVACVFFTRAKLIMMASSGEAAMWTVINELKRGLNEKKPE